MKKILLLGSGELGKEFVISAKRKGEYVIACDSYAGAPAMQVADCFEVIDMLHGEELDAVVKKHQPDKPTDSMYIGNNHCFVVLFSSSFCSC